MTPEQLAKSGTEHSHQTALFAWANMAAKYGIYTAEIPAAYLEKGWAKQYSKSAIESGNDYSVPQLDLLFAIHNQGHGDVIRGANAKAEGVKAGVPDIMLPVPKTYKTRYWNEQQNDKIFKLAVYNGLFIEMKRENKGVVSIAQSEFAFKVQQQGYKWLVCFGWLAAKQAILEYLEYD